MVWHTSKDHSIPVIDRPHRALVAYEVGVGVNRALQRYSVGLGGTVSWRRGLLEPPTVSYL